MEKATCSGCRAMLAPNEVLYTTDAKIVCQKCYAGADIVETDKRAGDNIKYAGFTAIGAAAFSFIFNPFFLLTITSVSSALYALKSLSNKQDERFTKHIAGDRTLIMACAAIALVINVIVVVIVITAVQEVTTNRGYRY